MGKTDKVIFKEGDHTPPPPTPHAVIIFSGRAAKIHAWKEEVVDSQQLEP